MGEVSVMLQKKIYVRKYILPLLHPKGAPKTILCFGINVNLSCHLYNFTRCFEWLHHRMRTLYMEMIHFLNRGLAIILRHEQNTDMTLHQGRVIKWILYNNNIVPIWPHPSFSSFPEVYVHFIHFIIVWKLERLSFYMLSVQTQKDVKLYMNALLGPNRQLHEPFRVLKKGGTCTCTMYHIINKDSVKCLLFLML